MSPRTSSELVSALVKATDDKERTGILYDLGETGDATARDLVAGFLRSPDSELRYVALSVLVLDWDLIEFAPEAFRLLLEDPDYFNRMLAATCVGSLFRGRSDPAALGHLIRVLKNVREELSGRLSSYAAIRLVCEKDHRVLDIEVVNLAVDVDWAFLVGIETTVEDAGFDAGSPAIREVQAFEASKPRLDLSPDGAAIRLLESGAATEDELWNILNALPARTVLPHFRTSLASLLHHLSPIRWRALLVLGRGSDPDEIGKLESRGGADAATLPMVV